MTPSSLIFFVIITVWAVYVIQHWIRRRDHVATARSVDRFSEAMRVLERRRVMPQMSVSAPQRSSYAVSLSRPAHPDVVVKRSQPRLAVVEDTAAPPHRPEPVRPETPAAATQSPPPTPRSESATGPGRESAKRHGRRKSAKGRSRRQFAKGRRRTSTVSSPLLSPARTRGLALLVGVALLAAGIGLAMTGTWYAAPAGVVAFGAALGYVRFSVARARRRATSPVRHPSARPQVAARPKPRRSSGAPRQVRRPSRRGAARLTGAPVAAARVRGSAPIYVSAQEPSAAPTRGDLYDVEAAEVATDRATEQPVPAVQDEPGTWEPVPVPPPTYTLKARAPRARERAAADTPVEDLPFDGNALALDEEFEDLPAVHQVV